MEQDYRKTDRLHYPEDLSQNRSEHCGKESDLHQQKPCLLPDCDRQKLFYAIIPYRILPNHNAIYNNRIDYWCRLNYDNSFRIARYHFSN